MRIQSRRTIAKFDPFTIEANYWLRYDLSFDIPEVEKIELHIHTKDTPDLEIIRLLDIPGWLWELLTDPRTLPTLTEAREEEEAPNEGAAQT